MWHRTLVSIVMGCLVSISIMLNLNYVLPFAVDVKLLLGLLVAFPIWVAVMIYCFACTQLKRVWLGNLVVLIGSASINALFLMSS